jgi:hypothetical protein
MATHTGTVLLVDPLADTVYLADGRSSAPEVVARAVREGATLLAEPEVLLLSTSTRRRSPTDLGYGGAPIVGSIFGSGVIPSVGRSR